MTAIVSSKDYVERVYAGILGKIIGVYLGRPFEGWSYERIMAELGEITYYVNDRLKQPLVVTDDDISGTFTFLRALADYSYPRDLSPEQIGQTWLNYLIEGKAVLWWGGLGNSTEHTAYLRLQQGIAAPRSGSIELNSKGVAEQIGAQIFIDGWAMVSPGDPAFAADLARRAASVSHDGEAVYAAQVLAAMEAQAFVESDIQALLDLGLSYIPRQSVIYRLIQDIRAWHAKEPDWHRARREIETHYGYHLYGGNCHIVPNHALIILALLYGEDDFQRSLQIANTSGWDTDCNSANVGCLLGIKNGLAAFTGSMDWRGPVRDRLYLPTADGGRSISDAVTETYHVVNTARALANMEPLAPKDGARFHFEMPGSLQGFSLQEERGGARLENVEGHSRTGTRCLAIYLSADHCAHLETDTFIPPTMDLPQHYMMLASPTLYPGQVVKVGLIAAQQNTQPVTCQLYLRYYEPDDTVTTLDGPAITLNPDDFHELCWRVPATNGAPIAAIGVALDTQHASEHTIYLDYLTWDGTPDLVLRRPPTGGKMWRNAWVNGVDVAEPWYEEDYRVVQNHGRGLLIHGAREWTNYRVSTTILPHLLTKAGLGAYVQGMRRYYALFLCNDGHIRLVKALDGDHVLAERPFTWEQGNAYAFSLQVVGTRIQAWIDGQMLFDVTDADRSLTGGGIALICEEGRIASYEVTVQPAG